MHVNTIGVDLAKNVFQVHGATFSTSGSFQTLSKNSFFGA